MDDEFHTYSGLHPTVMLGAYGRLRLRGLTIALRFLHSPPRNTGNRDPLSCLTSRSPAYLVCGHPARHLARGTCPQSPLRICGGPVGSAGRSTQPLPLPFDETTALYLVRLCPPVPGPIDYQQYSRSTWWHSDAVLDYGSLGDTTLFSASPVRLLQLALAASVVILIHVIA